MPVTLTSTGITYSDGTSTITNEIPQNTRMPFHQVSAPTGWTQDISDLANNRMLRFVNDATGGGYGGSDDPKSDSTVRAHTHTLTTGTESATHSHGDAGHYHGYTGSPGTNMPYRGANDGSLTAAPYGGTTGAASAALGGSTSDHSHSGTTNDSNVAATWTPRYTSLIVCYKN